MFPEHILVLFDQAVISPQLLSHAAKLATFSGASITMLNVLDSTISGPHEQFIDPLQWHMIKTEAESSLNKIAERLQGQGLQVQKTILETWSVERILKYIEDNVVDLIIVTKQGESIGAKLHTLLRHINIPMLIAPSKELVSDEITTDAYQKILVPLDGSQRAEIALPTAANLAKMFGACLLLAHIVHKPDMPSRTPVPPEDFDLLDRLVERNRAEAGKYLEQLVSRVDTKAETRLVVSERVSTALHQLSEQEAVDLVVLSAHGYSSERQWPYGSITGNLISYMRHPLLVIQDFPSSEVLADQPDVPIREKSSRM
ncbi:MAG TPA: universal stress protein [Oculatellaceae cyanobacterium]|nr:universal stress protein [Aggregatilineaceae bacterium]